ncbi:MAG: DNA mismatch repair protein MutS [Chitinophagaceae bacterium]|jgi:DNA mismatch repair protein MutS2|nr:DNA mismatch repair protein MutS [Chitinophagaceae bacterium]MCU0404994.1 DNA mismatch repair protein MutS [Chitinophagaceae bacterium]
MRLYPDSALFQLEFDKVQNLLVHHCKTDFAHQATRDLRIHTHISYIELALNQTHEFKLLIQTGQHFPIDFTQNIHKDIKLLGIPGASLTGEQYNLIRRLLDNAADIFRWFDTERREAFPALSQVIKESYYEKSLREMIDEVLDEVGQVKDTASEELRDIRMSLFRKRNELRRIFDRIVQKMNKQGYLSDIEESFINGRRVLAVFAENKRMIKGVLHGESDTRQTAFIEPEETTGLNNEIYSLENAERKEVYRILRQLTAKLQPFAPLMQTYLDIIGQFDFIRAKARLAIDMNANLPTVVNKAHIELKKAFHPLLFLYNKQSGKETIPLNIRLDDKNRILVISGPNAGGKTVTMKTIGLNQLMLQAGLLVPVGGDSVMGIFKQLFIHIGDTQSLEFELSTYSAHLQHMKYFIELANGKTLFFIDELGSGSDPNLGGAFAEVIMEELAHKHSMGVVTTHYLNLKVMANRVPGVINGAMQFDEEKLAPLYRLVVGKPGSSYTFSIAERIGLPKKLIEKAKKLVDEDHFKLDTLLNRTEQDLQRVESKERELQKLMKENERLKKEMEQVLDKEKHRQQVELLRQQNRIKEEQINYLKEMERKLKHMVIEWRKSENKDEVVRLIHALLFKQKEKATAEKKASKIDQKYIELSDPIGEGDQVKMKKNRQVGTVKEIRGKKAIVQVGLIPITVELADLVKVEERVVEGVG